MKSSRFLELSDKAIKGISVFLLTTIFFLDIGCAIIKSGGSPKKHGYENIDKYGCQEPPPDVFTSAGLDLNFASSTFGKIVTGEVKIQTNPEVIDLASKAVHEARIRDYLRCLAIKRDGYNLEQAAYLDSFNGFMAANPSATEFIEWQRNTPFPKSDQKQPESQDKTGSNKIEIKDSPGSIATMNQKGDNIILNPQVGIPDPRFTIEYISKNVLVDSLYKTEFLLHIKSKIQINNLYLEARAPSIVKFTAHPERTGMIASGHTGVRKGYAFTNLPNAWGTWKLIVQTKNVEDNIELDYNYE